MPNIVSTAINGLIRCEWCGVYGLRSIHPGLVNDSRLIEICTLCANQHITDAERGNYGKPIRFYETGIERYWREKEAPFLCPTPSH